MGNCLPFATKREMKMQLEQQRTFEINSRLCTTLETQLTRTESIAQNHLACAKHARRSKGVSKSIAIDRLRKHKTESAKADLLRRKLGNARTMLDAIEGAELTRQIFESATATSKFTKKYTLNPEKASQIMEAVMEAQDGARDTQDVLNELLPNATDSYLIDDDALMSELDTWLEEDDGVGTNGGVEVISEKLPNAHISQNSHMQLSSDSTSNQHEVLYHGATCDVVETKPPHMGVITSIPRIKTLKRTKSYHKLRQHVNKLENDGNDLLLEINTPESPDSRTSASYVTSL
jgi:ribosomal protein L22